MRFGKAGDAEVVFIAVPAAAVADIETLVEQDREARAVATDCLHR